MLSRCHAALIPATSQVGTCSSTATWQSLSVALKPVMPSSLVTARAFNWHISLVTARPYCLLSSTWSHNFFSSSGCLAFWSRNAWQLLFFSISSVYLFFFFVPVSNTTFAHIILSSRCTVFNVFCFNNYPNLFFRRERAITRSYSHSLFNTWFALHSTWRDHLFRGGAVPTLFQIMRAPQFFFAKFCKKYARNIRVYTVCYVLKCLIQELYSSCIQCFMRSYHHKL